MRASPGPPRRRPSPCRRRPCCATWTATRWRAGSASFSSSSAEPSAAQLPVLHERREEREQVLVLLDPRAAEPMDQIVALRTMPLVPRAQDRPPLVRDVLRLDASESGATEQDAIAVQRLKGGGRHPRREPRAFEIAEPAVRD